MKSVLKVTKLIEKAQIPAKGSIGAAGYDLRSIDNTVVPSWGKALISTGLAV